MEYPYRRSAYFPTMDLSLVTNGMPDSIALKEYYKGKLVLHTHTYNSFLQNQQYFFLLTQNSLLTNKL